MTEKKELPPLNPATLRFLNILKQFEGKQINLKQYSLMLGTSRRWVRYMISELRHKGYVEMIPANGKIHKSKACRYIFLDNTRPNAESFISEDIMKKLGFLS